jgi:hypothetical protein
LASGEETPGGLKLRRANVRVSTLARALSGNQRALGAFNYEIRSKEGRILVSLA